ncbi:hypothetical protein FA13DRAFT_1715242 [Coprinellus micaceus]|uniref:Uncharacterized protein n=1 Tax=Coprinellus micaceus TaxID=71717 RepID=A0A4Y7SP62_COPMI|nr:hypothetical protein FA13DRAFT_1715242 [Coprinellus micaceus]
MSMKWGPSQTAHTFDRFPNCAWMAMRHCAVSGYRENKAYIHRFQNLLVVWDFVRSRVTSWSIAKVTRPCEDQGRPCHTPTRWFVPSKWTARAPGIPVMITALAATTPHFQIRALTITVFLGSDDVRVGEQSVFDHPEVERLYRQVAFSPRPYSMCQGDCYVVGLVDVSHSGLLLHHSTFRGHAEDMKRWDSANVVPPVPCTVAPTSSLLCTSIARASHMPVAILHVWKGPLNIPIRVGYLSTTERAPKAPELGYHLGGVHPSANSPEERPWIFVHPSDKSKGHISHYNLSTTLSSGVKYFSICGPEPHAALRLCKLRPLGQAEMSSGKEPGGPTYVTDGLTSGALGPSPKHRGAPQREGCDEEREGATHCIRKNHFDPQQPRESHGHQSPWEALRAKSSSGWNPGMLWDALGCPGEL